MREVEIKFIKSCGENNPEKVQSYLNLAEDLEIDINAVDDYGDTAAHNAAGSGHTEIIRILAATDLVDWNKGGRDGWTPLHLALFCGLSDVVGIILKQDNINLGLKTQAGRTVAIAAVHGGSVHCVEILAEQENCNSWNIPDDNDGVTPLMEAIRGKMMGVLKVLLNCPRVDPNMKDKDGNSPVMKAIRLMQTE